jgi:hypothetical protein
MHKEGVPMKRAVLPLIAVVFSISSIPAFAQADKVSPHPVIDFPAPPPTLREFAADVDLVVVGRIRQVGRPILEKGGSREFVRRYHQVEIIDTVKGDASIQNGHILFVRQEGGTIETQGREVSTQYLQRLMETGDTFVLFLTRVPDSPPGRYYTALGPAGAIWINPHDRMGEITVALEV